MVEVCDNLSSVHGVLMHENLAIHEMVKEEEQRLVAEEQKALTEETKEHTEKQITLPGEQKMDPGEQKELTEEHKLPAGEQIELTEEQKKLTVERKEHTGEQTLTENQRELVKEQTMPAEVKMEHPDEHIAPTEGQKVPTEKATDEEQKEASVEKETPNEEQKVPIEEQHATTEEEKTSREGEKALVEGQREDAQEEREVGVGVALPCHEDDVTHAIVGTDEVDSKETDANNEVERQEEQEVNQAKQEVTDSHSQLAQKAADADRMVDLEQEQHGVENDGVPPQPLVEDFKGPAAVVESDVPEEPELGGSEQLHPSPTDEESRQPEAFKSTSSKEVWDGVSADAPASKVAGTDSHEMEEKVDGNITSQGVKSDKDKVAVKDEEGKPGGEGIEHITKDSGEKGIPTGREEEELTALGEAGRKAKVMN